MGTTWLNETNHDYPTDARQETHMLRILGSWRSVEIVYNPCIYNAQLDNRQGGHDSGWETNRACHNIIIANLKDKIKITYNPQTQRLLLTLCMYPSRCFLMCTYTNSHTSIKKLSIYTVLKLMFLLLISETSFSWGETPFSVS